MAVAKFSGLLPSSSLYPAVTTTQVHADSGSDSTHAPMTSSHGFIPASCTVTELHVDPTLNTTAAGTTFTVYKNGSATAVTVTVGSASTTPQTDSTHTATFNGTTDIMDLVSVRSGSLATQLAFSASIKTTPL